MARCDACNREMLDPHTVSCTNPYPIIIGGVLFDPLPFGYEEQEWGNPVDANRRCHDCNVALGGSHHPSCDQEICPKCHGQIISCGCLDGSDDALD